MCAVGYCLIDLIVKYEQITAYIYLENTALVSYICELTSQGIVCNCLESSAFIFAAHFGTACWSVIKSHFLNKWDVKELILLFDKIVVL